MFIFFVWIKLLLTESINQRAGWPQSLIVGATPPRPPNNLWKLLSAALHAAPLLCSTLSPCSLHAEETGLKLWSEV